MLRRNTLAALAVLASLSAPAALHGQDHGTPVMSGAWDLEFAAPWGMVVWTFELKHDGHAVTGESPQGMGTLMLDGTIDGHDIDFVVDLADGPHALTIGFTGTVGPGAIGGTVEFEDGSSSDWTLTRVESPTTRR